jgi:uncharacterized NAD(P)/FAD-binding protein YdhS
MIRSNQSAPTHIAFIGLGPWGLAALERMLAVAGRRSVDLVAHVVEPEVRGAGVFAINTPAYLPLNTPCGQHSMFPDPECGGAPAYSKSLHRWAVDAGYRWVDGTCIRSCHGEPIQPGDFLPRRLMGEWLRWSYLEIVASAPAGITVIEHPTMAVDIERLPTGQERVHLANGETIDVEHAILATGHTPDRPALGGPVGFDPYPVGDLDARIESGSTVAVAGLGLVALDVVAGLTVGRGGRFVEAVDGLSYRPSGCEPQILLFSRSGQPYAAKAVGATDPTGRYVPVICTMQAIRRLRLTDTGELRRRRISLRRTLLPLLTAEMTVAFYRQSAFLAHGSEAADEVSRTLAAAWVADRFEAEVDQLALVHGAFDANRHLLGDEYDTQFPTSGEYEKTVLRSLEADIAEALSTRGSPVKAAYDTLRAMRDTMRFAIEFEGLDDESYKEFFSGMANRFKSLVAGPPVRRSEELVALMEAGILRIPWGPSPEVEHTDAGYLIRSTHLQQEVAIEVDHLVRGFLPEPTIRRSASPLIRHLSRQGRIKPVSYGCVESTSIALTEHSQPIGTDGSVQTGLWVFGALTEGTRYFTQYVPSPKSRVRAFVDAEECAELIMEGAATSTDLPISEAIV